jgi:hypothetical protein
MPAAVAGATLLARSLFGMPDVGHDLAEGR